MSAIFLGVTVLMLLLAIAILVMPLLKARDVNTVAYKDSNLNINDQKLQELDADLKEGRIDQMLYAQAKEELDRELLIDIPAESVQAATLNYTARVTRHPALAILIIIFIPMVTLLVYWEIGMYEASDASFVASQQQGSQRPQLSIEEMADKLEAHIIENGGTVEEWQMLGRSHKLLGRYQLAANAFKAALETDVKNAQLMLEAAEMIALKNERVFNEEARALVLKAYSLEPDNMNVLWFTGVAEYQFKNYQLAIKYLLQMLPMAKQDEDVFKSVIGIIAQSRKELIDAGNEMPELETMLGIKQGEILSRLEAKPKDNATDDVTTSLKVSVRISDEARSKFMASDLVFVYAKAKQGPRMPLAVQRLTLADLPTTVILDDSMAMVEGMNLSAFEQLVVSARITKSGAAITQSGDYVGSVGVGDKLKEAVFDIVIDTVVP